MARNFSKSFKTYSDWLSNAPNTAYTRRIVKGHAKYPNSTLNQLRGHPIAREKGLFKLKPKPIYQLSQNQLTARQFETRRTSLEVLSELRKGKGSLSHLSRLHHTTPETVRKYTNAIKKDGNRLKAKRFDKIERKMKIIENGEEITITINDSRYASIIGKYHSAINLFFESGDESYLEPFKNVRIKDSNGNWHTLDTDPDNLYNIREQRPDEEFYTIYSE